MSDRLLRLPSGKEIPVTGIPEGATNDEIMIEVLRQGKAYYSDFYPKTGGEIDVQANRRAALEEWGRELPNENNDNTFGGLLQRAGRAVVPDWLERGMMGVSRPITTASYRINQAANAAGLPVDEQEMQRRKFDVEAYRALPKGAADVGETALAMATLNRLPLTFAGGGAGSAAYGALTEEDPLMGAAGGFIGNTVGLGATKLGGRAFNALRGRFADRAVRGTSEASDLARQMQQEGFRVKPGEAAGRGWRKRVDDFVQNTPGLGWAYDQMDDLNQIWINTRVGKAMGLATDDLGPTARGAARRVINQEFDDVAKHIDAMPVAPDLIDDVTDLLRPRKIQELGLTDTFKQLIDPLKAAFGGDSFTIDPDLGLFIPSKMFKQKLKTMTGKQYMNLRSALGELASRVKYEDLNKVWDLMDELDEVAENYARPGFKEAYKVARERYKTWLSVDAYRRGVNAGDVNASTFDGALQKVFKSMYKENRPTILPETREMFDAVRHMANPRFQLGTTGSQTAGRMLPMAEATALLGGLMTMGTLPTLGAAGGLSLASGARLAQPASEALQRGVTGPLRGLAAANPEESVLAALGLYELIHRKPESEEKVHEDPAARSYGDTRVR